jgi:hypothetical protein
VRGDLVGGDKHVSITTGGDYVGQDKTTITVAGNLIHANQFVLPTASELPPTRPGRDRWRGLIRLSLTLGILVLALLALARTGVMGRLLAATQATPTSPVTATEVTGHETTTGDIGQVTASPAAMAAPTLPSAPCPYEGAAPHETFENLIQAESDAVNQEDIAIIRAIFAAGAAIRDAKSGASWHDPVERYSELFANEDFRNVYHDHIRPAGAGSQGSVAWYTSGNRGENRKADSDWQPFENGSSLETATPYGSDQWTLRRDSNGCWLISEFTFNAGHEEFP